MQHSQKKNRNTRFLLSNLWQRRGHKKRPWYYWLICSVVCWDGTLYLASLDDTVHCANERKSAKSDRAVPHSCLFLSNHHFNLICRLSGDMSLPFAADRKVGLVLFGWTRGQEWTKQSKLDTLALFTTSALRQQGKKYTCDDDWFFELSQSL